MRYQGKITGWVDEKGYGFVMPNGGGTKAFVHIKAFVRKPNRPANGDLITYELWSDVKGRPVASNIQFALIKPVHSAQTGWHGSILAVLFLMLLWILGYNAKLPLEVAFIYSGASVLAILMYSWDKSAAKVGADRIRESTLQTLSLLGGWPGALIAQKLFRHKNRKPEFQKVFWLTVLINCMVLLFIFIF